MPDGGTAVEIGCGPGATLADFSRARPAISTASAWTRTTPWSRTRTRRTATTGFASPSRRWAATRYRRRQASCLRSTSCITSTSRRGFLRAVTARALAPAGVVAAIEPNSLHPYVALSQERMRAGPRRDTSAGGIWESAFAAAGLRVDSRSWLHAFPACVRSVPSPAARLERLAERVPPLAGSVAYVLRRHSRRAGSRERSEAPGVRGPRSLEGRSGLVVAPIGRRRRCRRASGAPGPPRRPP